MAQNPVISRFGRASGGENTPSAGDLQVMFDKPAYTGPRQSARYMTLDDVVVRTGAMLGTILLAGAHLMELAVRRGCAAGC